MLKKTVISLLALALFSQFASHGMYKALASEFTFAIEAIIPDNQVTPGVTFFDVLVEPGGQQVLQLNLWNDLDRDVTVVPEIATATTNHNGVVEYSPRDVAMDSNLRFRMEDVVTTVESITIPAQSSVILELEVNMPDEEFDGILAGGLTLQELEEEDEGQESGDAGVSIRNRFAFVVAILLRNNQDPIVPDLTVNDVFPSQINRRNVIQANIQNITPRFVNELAIEAVLYRVGQDEPVLEVYQNMMQMAPHSNMDFPLRLAGQPLQAGDYILNLRLESGDQYWEFSEPFTIDAEVAEELNALDVEIVHVTDWTWAYIAAGVAVLVISNIVVILIMKRKRK
ncbi:MAG: DUF916 and DUF3324 domain-containing protein [Turicibacter sp.]|nr:DUF916 and DUF3324 domain-containing protein [Turicibacter sp.]